MRTDSTRLSALFGEASLDLAIRDQPADGGKLSGDVCDAVPTPEGPRLLLGDVKGHGPVAAPLAAEARAAFHRTGPIEPDLVGLAHRLDAQLRPHMGPEDFVTLLLADLRPAEIRLVNCGHPPPLRVGHRLTPLTAPHPSPPLGLDPEPQLHRAQLHPRRRLLLHTDGLSEARAPDGTPFPLDGRARAALNAPTPDIALDQLLELLCQHTGQTRQADDLTLLLLQSTSVPSLAPQESRCAPREAT